jgi:hypothetical protein
MEATLDVVFEKVTLPIGTQICKVRDGANGGCYEFDASEHGLVWRKFSTIEDLPAFTDRGIAKAEDRELSVHPALKRGRPPSEEEKKPLGVKLSDAQRAWVEYRAKLRKVTASEFVREVLQRRGMP